MSGQENFSTAHVEELMDVRDVETEARAGEAIEEEVDVEGSGSGEDQEDSMIVIEGQDQDTLPAHELISKLAEALEFKDTCLVDSVPAKGFGLRAMGEMFINRTYAMIERHEEQMSLLAKCKVALERGEAHNVVAGKISVALRLRVMDLEDELAEAKAEIAAVKDAQELQCDLFTSAHAASQQIVRLQLENKELRQQLAAATAVTSSMPSESQSPRTPSLALTPAVTPKKFESPLPKVFSAVRIAMGYSPISASRGSPKGSRLSLCAMDTNASLPTAATTLTATNKREGDVIRVCESNIGKVTNAPIARTTSTPLIGCDGNSTTNHTKPSSTMVSTAATTALSTTSSNNNDSTNHTKPSSTSTSATATTATTATRKRITGSTIHTKPGNTTTATRKRASSSSNNGNMHHAKRSSMTTCCTASAATGKRTSGSSGSSSNNSSSMHHAKRSNSTTCAKASTTTGKSTSTSTSTSNANKKDGNATTCTTASTVTSKRSSSSGGSDKKGGNSIRLNKNTTSSSNSQNKNGAESRCRVNGMSEKGASVGGVGGPRVGSRVVSATAASRARTATRRKAERDANSLPRNKKASRRWR